MVESRREIGGHTSTEVRYFIRSLAGESAQKFAHAARSHWVLEMAFDEDRSRVRTGNAAENMAMLRHVALNRRKKASWSGDFMMHLLGFKTAYQPDKKRRQSRQNG